MPHAVQIIASSAATVIAIIAYIPYLIDMFKGKNKPHLYTWISFTLITAVVAYLQLIGGAGVGSIPTIISAIIDGIILFYCFKYGTKDVIFIDKVCLTISVLGVVSYVLLKNDPVIALVIVTAAEVISFIPTFRKTRNDPYSESLTSYYLVMLKLVLILVALEQYNLLTASYSVLWLIVFTIYLSLTFYWRIGKKPQANGVKNNPDLIV